MDKQIAIKELLYKIADDQLILGHRNSEWTGLGPILEEDIAFSSMAQDKLGQSQAIYNILNTLGEQDADTLAFMRNSAQFHCSHLVEMPIGGYDFSLIRHFLFDHAEWLRFDMLINSSFEPISKLARKYRGEIKYHIMHADVWLKQLGNATEESHNRMQVALDNAFNMALGIFETGPHEQLLQDEKIFEGENILYNRWLEKITPIIIQSNLKLPAQSASGGWNPSLGGRYGKHTEYLQPLLDEMTEVFKIDPSAEW
ncbi:MAG: 1,2-phenylacetyl-CoA epoxidase subunit PaaC [Bacteroidota bacterium]|nr:1,2-phenylacetyl-CoA epoxidase subunit PaaC [Bacteroidota bacterium]